MKTTELVKLFQNKKDKQAKDDISRKDFKQLRRGGQITRLKVWGEKAVHKIACFL